MPSPGVLGGAAPISWRIIVSLVVCHVAAKWIVFQPFFYDRLAAPLFELSSGVLTPSVTAGAAQFASMAIVFGLLVRRFKWSSVGISSTSFASAIPVVFLLWAVSQAVIVLMIAGTGGIGRLFELWQMPGGIVAGSFAEAFVTAAFTEEVFYRGLLMPQAYLLVRGWVRSDSSAVAIAACTSQAYFATMHVPSALRMGLAPITTGMYLFEVFLVGLLFVAIYLVTENLFIAVGIHGLLNLPAPIFEPAPASMIVLVTAVLLMTAWPVIGAEPTPARLSPVRAKSPPPS